MVGLVLWMPMARGRPTPLLPGLLAALASWSIGQPVCDGAGGSGAPPAVAGRIQLYYRPSSRSRAPQQSSPGGRVAPFATMAVLLNP
jgi:hypothetical protein